MIDLRSMNDLFKAAYAPARLEALAYGGGYPLSYYLHAEPAVPYRWPRSKSRRHYRRQAIKVAQDFLHQCGLWPFKRADWFPDLRTREDKAADMVGRGLLSWLPQTAETREALRLKLEAAGLLGTEAARRFLERPVDERRMMYGMRRTGARLDAPIVLK